MTEKNRSHTDPQDYGAPLRFRRLRLTPWVIAVLSVALLWSVSPNGVGPAGLSVSAMAQEKPPYRFGVFPFMSLSRLENVFAPMATDLGAALNRKVQFRSSSSFDRFADNLSRQMYSIAFIQPFDYVKVATQAGYLPLVARADSLSAIITVLPDSPYLQVEDLKGLSIALPPSTAAVSYLTILTLLQMDAEPGRDVSLIHTRTHDSCLQQLLIKQVAACGTAPAPLKVFESKMNIKFRILRQSTSIPGSLFIVHSSVPDPERKIIKDTLLSLSLSPEGKILFGTKNRPLFKIVNDADYDVVRQYWQEIQSLP